MFEQFYGNNIDIRKSDYKHIQIYRYTIDSVKNITKKKWEKKNKNANLECKPDDEEKTEDIKAKTDEIGGQSFRLSSLWNTTLETTTTFPMLITSTMGCA